MRALPLSRVLALRLRREGGWSLFLSLVLPLRDGVNICSRSGCVDSIEFHNTGKRGG